MPDDAAGRLDLAMLLATVEITPPVDAADVPGAVAGRRATGDRVALCVDRHGASPAGVTPIRAPIRR